MRFFTAVVEKMGGENEGLSMEIATVVTRSIPDYVLWGCSGFFHDSTISEIQYQYLLL